MWITGAEPRFGGAQAAKESVLCMIEIINPLNNVVVGKCSKDKHR